MATILMADDARFVRMRIDALLRDLGHDVLEAEDGQRAVELYKRNRPDAVLLDVTMPVMDGIEALRQILAFDPSASVALVTAMGQRQVIIEAVKLGAKDFVVKPFEADRLLACVWKLVA